MPRHNEPFWVVHEDGQPRVHCWRLLCSVPCWEGGILWWRLAEFVVRYTGGGKTLTWRQLATHGSLCVDDDFAISSSNIPADLQSLPIVGYVRDGDDVKTNHRAVCCEWNWSD